MKLHLSESTRELLEFLDGTVFPVWNSPTAEDIDTRLIRSMNRIQACRREFDARLFFIVVFGPLKSGKSTLVNTLARQYVSPTRFARESTRRASIVIRGKKSGIQQYFWKHETPDSSPDERKEAFERVIQYLRGVLTLAILEPDIQIVDQAYDKQAVDRLLAGPLEREPLITVIRCPGGQLIGEEISVLDVPGLDGFMTNTENNPAAFWIIDKSDLLIFTQSSFAPLNNQTSKYLRDLYDGSRKPPVLLVQNQIEARHWADPLEQQRETDEQVMVARKEISELLAVPGARLPAWPINLGKAHDGYFKKMPELLDDSKFEVFESELQKYLESSRMELHEKNCLNEMAGEITQAEQIIETISQEMDSRLKQEQINLALLRQCREEFQNLTYSTRWIEQDFVHLEHSWIKNQLELANEFVRSQCATIASELDSSIQGKMVKGRTINQIILNYSEQLLSEVRNRFLSPNDELVNQLGKIFAEGAAHVESVTLREISTTLQSLKLDPLPPPHPFEPSDIPPFPGKGLEFDAYEESFKILGFIPWPRKFPKGAVEEAIRKDLAAQWSQALEELAQKWMNHLKEGFAKASRLRRQNPALEHLDTLLAAQTQKHHQAKEEMSETNESLDQIHTQITAIKNRLLARPSESNIQSLIAKLAQEKP